MLNTIPEEVLGAVVVQCAAIDPGSLASLAQTGSSLRRLICQPEDQHLWRNIYLEIFDDPRYALGLHNGTLSEAQAFDWKTQTQRIFRAAFRLRKAGVSDKDTDYYFDEDASEAFLLVAQLACPCNSDVDMKPSKNEAWLNETLGGVVLPLPTNQAFARLNLLACFFSTVNSVTLPLVSLPSRLPSRAFLYDLANYAEESGYGPWLPDGRMRVNWQHLWHAMNVIRQNIRERSGWNITPGGKFTNFRANSACMYMYYNSLPEKENIPMMNDWAGVSGLYTRAICYMDYHDLYTYNHSTLLGRRPLQTSILEQDEFAEDLRIVATEFEVTSVDEVGPPEFPHRPTIHFRGRSGFLSDNDDSQHGILRGAVSMSPDGHIRWSFVTKVDGHEWSSEGVQLGGVQSAAGVVGTWTSSEHRDEAPVGPFWLWKTEDYRKTLHKVQANWPRTDEN